jgi:hypothetical protein
MMLRALFGRIRERINPLPDLRAQPDMTGAALGMDWLVAALGENKEMPRAGDVIIHIVSCGMGVSVRRDLRYRVTGPGRNARSVSAVKEDGTTVDNLYVFYMRRHQQLARTWILMD